MVVLFYLVVFNVFLHGIIAGTSTDVAFVKLPTRRRIGTVAYAQFARGNDLGNGLVVYPLLGITAFISTFGTTVLALFFILMSVAMLPLYLACFFTVAHTLTTAKAAPLMLSLRNVKDEESLLKQKLDRFAFWHALRTVFQIVTFICWIFALILINK